MEQGDDDDAMPGQDSFIDVVCNMVGILIVLVMIVGVRASSAGPDSTPTIHAVEASYNAAGAKSIQELSEVHQRTALMQREIEGAVGRVVDLETQSMLVETRREQLSLVRAAVEQEIEERRSKLSTEEQRQFDVQRQIAESEIKLHELTQQQIAVAAEATHIERVECVPTPIAREVTGEEIHVQIRNGRLAVVPTDLLVAEMERRGAHYIRNGLDRRNQAEESYGPIDGFRLRFFVARREVDHMPGVSHSYESDGPRVFLRFTFLPVTEQIGMPIEQALLPDSNFMIALRSKRSAAPTVVAWVYRDSFSELRTLKRELWKAGLPLAVRPLANNQPIQFVTGGSKTVAQ